MFSGGLLGEGQGKGPGVRVKGGCCRSLMMAAGRFCRSLMMAAVEVRREEFGGVQRRERH